MTLTTEKTNKTKLKLTQRREAEWRTSRADDCSRTECTWTATDDILA